MRAGGGGGGVFPKLSKLFQKSTFQNLEMLERLENMRAGGYNR